MERCCSGTSVKSCAPVRCLWLEATSEGSYDPTNILEDFDRSKQIRTRSDTLRIGLFAIGTVIAELVAKKEKKEIQNAF